MLLNKNDLCVLNDLMTLDEKGTMRYLTQLLYKYYDKNNILDTDSYILVFGTMPIALVAHCDTVEENNKIELSFVYDPIKELGTSINGLGLDDKLGIFSILKLLEKGYRPNIIFTTGEERGGVGADALITIHDKCPFDNIKYLLELDRAGYLNYVTYSNDDDMICQYLEGKTKYVKDIGSFSDVEVLGPAWNIGFVNMSIAYYWEHTHDEYVNFKEWEDCINEVEKLLKDIDSAPYFNYVKKQNSFLPFDATNGLISCENCGKKVSSDNYIDVIDEFGLMVTMCRKCADMMAQTCKKCGTYYIPDISNDSGKCCYCNAKKFKQARR